MLFGKKYEKKKTTNVDLNDFFRKGIEGERNKKIKMRNDVNLVFYPGGIPIERKKDKLSDYNLKYKLSDGSNLFDLPVSEFKNRRDIYEIKLLDIKNFALQSLSTIPNLNILSIQFSTLNIGTSPQFPHNYFINLEHIDLSFNNLPTEVLEILRCMKQLKTINLSGNYIDYKICDISCLNHLQELNLSHNRIESIFIQGNGMNSIDLDDKEDKFELNNGIKEIINIDRNSKNRGDQEYSKNISLSNALISEDIIDANFLKRDLRASEEIKQKFNNSDANESNKAKEAIKFEEEFNVEDMKKTKETYNQVQKYFKTNIRQFFHNISQLFNLKKLDLSNNKIHFFDIDPFFIQKTEGFRALTHLDLSNNLIKEEIGILLVMNLPLIECLKFTGNPLLQDKKSFEKIEYEIFRNKNILLENELNMMKEKRSNYKGHFICAIKPLKVNVSDSDKLLAKKIRPATCEERKKNENEKENEIFYKTNYRFNKKEDIKAKENVFLTDYGMISRPKKKNINPEYLEFLKLAKRCLGTKKHYKELIPIDNAYAGLKNFMESLPDEGNNLNQELNEIINEEDD